MSLLEILRENKGTVSSALGKELAQQVLNGNIELLNEALVYTSYDPENIKSKSIRAGAAKIVEKVAEKEAELVAPHLEILLPALEMPEPQTRWMIILAFGYCINDNPDIALKGIDFAKRYIQEKKGVCLSGAAHLYLGRAGAVSGAIANDVFPILLNALDKAAVNEVDWIIEAFIRISHNLTKNEKEVLRNTIILYSDAPKKSTKKRIEKLLKKIEES